MLTTVFDILLSHFISTYSNETVYWALCVHKYVHQKENTSSGQPMSSGMDMNYSNDDGLH